MGHTIVMGYYMGVLIHFFFCCTQNMSHEKGYLILRTKYFYDITHELYERGFQYMQLINFKWHYDSISYANNTKFIFHSSVHWIKNYKWYEEKLWIKKIKQYCFRLFDLSLNTSPWRIFLFVYLHRRMKMINNSLPRRLFIIKMI